MVLCYVELVGRVKVLIIMNIILLIINENLFFFFLIIKYILICIYLKPFYIIIISPGL